jgi:RNA polymerase sigma-70 factor (sigma-E family)
VAGRDRDDADFAVFVGARSQRLLRTAFALTQDAATAEDLLRAALAKSWPAWGRIDDDPEPHVLAVLVSTYLSFLSFGRRRWRAQTAAASMPDIPDPGTGVGEHDRQALWLALATLPARQRAVVVLRYLEDLSEAETARMLGVGAATVKARTGRALAALGVAASQRGHDGEDASPGWRAGRPQSGTRGGV